MSRPLVLPALLACLLLVACPPEVEEPPAECELTADSWQPGEQAFREATADWGLEGMVTLGVRVSVTDIDGDGWPDLLTRNGGGPDDFATDGGQRRWVLRNTGQGTFEDVTEASGLFTGRLDGVSGSRPAEVMMSGDVDNDGDLDVFTALTREDPYADSEMSELMLNDGSGVFSLCADSSWVADWLSVPVGATFVDADLDGALDIFVSNNRRTDDSSPLQDRFFLGLGDGTFVESTEAMGMTTSQWNSVETLNEAGGHTSGWGATSCDLNNDGLPEIMSTSYGRAPNHLWRAREGGDEGVEFRNKSLESGYASDHRDEWWTNYNAQCYCADNPSAEDCDLAPEPDDYGLCQMLYNGFGGTYRWNHAGDREPWRLGGNSATTTCVDVNNDGWLDLFTGEIAHWDVGPNSDPAEIVLNTRDEGVVFDRPGNEVTGIEREGEDETGWDHGDMNNAVLDFDNDGRMDIYLSTSDYPDTRGNLFHQKDNGTFEQVDIDDAIDHLRSAGATAVDLDRDGDLDIVVGHSRMRCGGSYPNDCYDKPYVRIFENLADDRNNWVELRLEGADGTNRSAIGARVTVDRCGETLTRTVDGGHGHVGTQEDTTLHFGLGDTDVAGVTVYWPDMLRSSQTFTVAAGFVYEVKQGEAPVEWTP